MVCLEKYKKTQEYLDSFINYEKSASFPYKQSLKLERVKFFLEDVKIPYKNLKAIHIAGTKGKGSTATMCADLLAEAGYRIGLYTSPHFFDFRERIVIKSPQAAAYRPQKNLISKKDVVEIVEEMMSYLEKWRFTKEWGKLTFFEIYTAIAFKYFIDRKVDFAVLETGMGGRLDATNVVNPLISIITSIGYDHTDKLGTKLSQIAYEKAGIIKRYVPVVSAFQKKSVCKVIAAVCKRMQAELFMSDRDFKAETVKLKKDHTIFDFKFNDFVCKNIKIVLKGRCQAGNAALSLAAVKLLKDKKILEKKIDFKKGLINTRMPGRFEVIENHPLIVLDVAHNEPSFAVLRENLKAYFPRKKIIFIFAASNDKNIGKMLKLLDYSQIVLTKFNNPRSACPQEIKEKYFLKNALVAGDVSKAFKIAKELYNKDSLILVSGSMFLAAEAKKIIK